MEENFKNESLDNIELTTDFVIKQLDLSFDKNADTEIFRLGHDSRLLNTERVADTINIIDSPDKLYPYFEGIEVSNADPLRRPIGDATFFTTAGIQHIETILFKENKLDKQSFIIVQPSIRNQFIDKTSEGCSTSFVDFCVADIRTTPQDYINLCNKYIDTVIQLGADPKLLGFNIEDSEDVWGSKEIKKTILTLSYNNIELGEAVYVHNYPVGQNERIAITDISFGIERLNWAFGENNVYFQEFKSFYPENISPEKKNEITRAIDCIRTATLVAGEGVESSHVNPGRVLRQLIKRFVKRNKEFNFSIDEMVSIANNYWQKWGFRPTVELSQIADILRIERDRSMNVLLMELLKEQGGPSLSIDVNQSFEEYISTIHKSFGPRVIELVNNIIKNHL